MSAAENLSDCTPALTPVERDDPRFAEIARIKMARLQAKASIKILMIGDSLIHRWPGDLPPDGAFNFGGGGDRTEHLLWRLQHTKLPATGKVVLLIGTNNLPRDTVPCAIAGIRACIASIKAQLPVATLYVLGLLPRGQPAHAAEKVPTVNRALADATGYRFFNFTTSFEGRPDFYRGDGLIPRRQYRATIEAYWGSAHHA